MAWKATVTNTDVTNGALRIDVTYTDGTALVRERIETRSGQSATWLTDTVKRRITELAGVDDLVASIPLGPVTIPEDPPPSNTPRDQYIFKLNQFNAALNAMRMGLITEDAQAFANLRTWLRTNFLPEYLDLFL